jgi:hypothetical protein
MAGQNIIINVNRGDEIVVYAYTGTWLADFPMNHYTHWVGMLLKPNADEILDLRPFKVRAIAKKEIKLKISLRHLSFSTIRGSGDFFSIFVRFP